jgi:hypothetical protein
MQAKMQAKKSPDEPGFGWFETETQSSKGENKEDAETLLTCFEPRHTELVPIIQKKIRTAIPVSGLPGHSGHR